MSEETQENKHNSSSCTDAKSNDDKQNGAKSKTSDKRTEDSLKDFADSRESETIDKKSTDSLKVDSTDSRTNEPLLSNEGDGPTVEKSQELSSKSEEMSAATCMEMKENVKGQKRKHSEVSRDEVNVEQVIFFFFS